MRESRGLQQFSKGGLAWGVNSAPKAARICIAARVALRWIPDRRIENNLIASVTADRSEVPAL